MVFKLYILPFALSLLVTIVTARLLRKSQLSRPVKMTVFSLIGSFLFFPMLIGGPGMFIPIPAFNSSILIAALVTDTFRELPKVYGQLWQITLISWPVTLFFFLGVSMLVFRKNTLPK